MAPARNLKSQSLFDKDVLLRFLEERVGNPGTAAKHCRAILNAAIRDAERGLDAVDLSEMRVPSIPQWARDEVPKRFSLLTTKISTCATSSDGSTTKMVVELQDGTEAPPSLVVPPFSAA